MKRRHYYILTLVFFAGLVAFDLSWFMSPDKLRRLLRAELEENLKVPVEYVSIEFRGLTEIKVSGITARRGHHTEEPVLYVKELIAVLDLWTLLRGDIKVKRLELIEPRLYLKWDADGNLDLPSVVRGNE